MAEYQESAISGTRYRHPVRAIIARAPGQPPTLRFAEEQVVVINGEKIARLVSNLEIPYAAQEEFPLRNLQTNEIIEGQTGTQVQFYRLLYSMYWHYALARDGG